MRAARPQKAVEDRRRDRHAVGRVPDLPSGNARVEPPRDGGLHFGCLGKIGRRAEIGIDNRTLLQIAVSQRLRDDLRISILGFHRPLLGLLMLVCLCWA
jgi:hypothetical protein